MGLVDPFMLTWVKYFECPFHSFRPGIRGRELLEDANSLVCDWVFALLDLRLHQLSDLDAVCPPPLFCGDSILIFSFYRSNDLWGTPMDRLWII